MKKIVGTLCAAISLFYLFLMITRANALAQQINLPTGKTLNIPVPGFGMRERMARSLVAQ